MIPGLKTEAILDGKAAVISMDGQIPADAMSEVSEEILSAIKEPCRYLVIDCSRLTSLTEVSLGLGLVAYYDSVIRQRGGELLIVLPPPEVMSQLQSDAPMNVVRLVNTREEAIKYVTVKLKT